MSYTDRAALAQDVAFGARVRVALVIEALAVSGQPDDGAETTRLRRAHGINVLLDQDAYAARYAWAVATDPAITTASPDPDIQTSVAERFNAMAGAPPGPAPLSA